MHEVICIWRDLRSGALPLEEVPGFVLFLLGRTFWLWAGLIGLGLGVVLWQLYQAWG